MPPARTTAGPASRPVVLAFLVVLLTCSVAPAQAPPAATGGPPGLASLFPHRAPILVDPHPGAGADGRLARLLVPPEVLSSCRPDLSDLRILDPGGREVPFLVDAGRGSGERLEVLETVRPEILDATRTTIERDGVPDLRRESYELSAPPPTQPGEGWELVVESERARFVRRVVVAPTPLEPNPVEESDRLGRPEPIDPPGAAEGSIFRLPAAPSSIHVREHLRLPLPLSVSSLAGERLRVTLEGEEGSYLEPGFRYERSRRLPGRARARVALTVLAVRSGSRRTVVELERPRGLVPDLLALETATPAFSRRVEVWDEGPGAVDVALGSTTLYRVPAVATVENLEIPLYPARGDRLRLVIHDGDSPPLEEPVLRAAVRRPALLFGLESAGEEPAGTLLFGGGRAYRPHYDLAALQATLASTRTPEGAGGSRGEEGPISSAAAHIVRSLVDPDRLAAARLGPIEPNPRHDPSPALAFAHRPGAPVDAALYRYRRSLRATPSSDGLSSLPLTPEDLALAQADLGDLRIVDPRARQWAYLVERGAERDLRDLPAERLPSERRGLSRYEIGLPARPATVDRLIVDCSAAFFDRPFTLRGTPSGAGSEEDARTLAHGRLRRRVGDPRPVTLAFPAARIDRLVLEVEDGDDAPLEIRRVEGRFPLPTLYFPAPQGEYALLLGNPQGEAPSYELTRARDLVLAVTAEPARPGPLGENPEYRAGRHLLSKEGAQRLLLWGALGVAVLALAFLTLRLARRG